MRALLLPLVSGLLLCLSFPQISLFPLALAGLAPFFWFAGTERSWKSLLLGHLVFSLVFYGGVLIWIPRVLVVYGGLSPIIGGLALLIMALAMGSVLLPFSLLFQWGSRRAPRTTLLAAPGLWILTELIRNFAPFDGFPWASLGYSQVPFVWLSQTADLGSVYLVSGLVVLTNSSLVLLARYRDWRKVCLTSGLVFLGCLYGIWRMEFPPPSPEHSVRVGVAQGNIDLMADRNYYAGKYFRTLPELFDQASEQGAEWIIFPEAQNPYRYPGNFYFREFWETRVQRKGVHLLFNSTSVEETGYYNSAYLLAPDGRPVRTNLCKWLEFPGF